ncbi:MAG: hypothetical protein M3O26_21560 [Pseudomonadota bacterium]|nr:hypothetical protein [Pseudomonadota bacterium]
MTAKVAAKAFTAAIWELQPWELEQLWPEECDWQCWQTNESCASERAAMSIPGMRASMLDIGSAAPHCGAATASP